jgi:hypothetical protein
VAACVTSASRRKAQGRSLTQLTPMPVEREPCTQELWFAFSGTSEGKLISLTYRVPERPLVPIAILWPIFNPCILLAKFLCGRYHRRGLKLEAIGHMIVYVGAHCCQVM